MFGRQCVSPYRAAACIAGRRRNTIFAFVISRNEVFAASVLTVRHKTLTAFLLSESPLQAQFAGGLLLIALSVAFMFLVRRCLFAMWGITSR